MGILQPRILEWVAYPFYKGSSWPRNRTGVSCIAGRFFSSWATREACGLPYGPWIVYSCTPWLREREGGFSVTQYWIKYSDIRSFNKKDDCFQVLNVHKKTHTLYMILHLGFIMFVCLQNHKVWILKLISIYLSVKYKMQVKGRFYKGRGMEIDIFLKFCGILS